MLKVVLALFAAIILIGPDYATACDRAAKSHQMTKVDADKGKVQLAENDDDDDDDDGPDDDDDGRDDDNDDDGRDDDDNDD